LFISWKHYVPNYVRTEIKKKTGTVIDKFGNYVSDAEEAAEGGGGGGDVNAMMYTKKGAAAAATVAKKPAGDFKPIASYKPTGNLIYNQELFRKIEDRV
jgi:hypothetical protein